MTSGPAFYFTYPSTISASSTLVDCYISFNAVIYQMTCTVDTTARVVKVYGNGSTTGLNVGVPAASTLAITFGQMVNPTMQSSSMGTLTMVSYTDSTFSNTYD